ncbi:MarR family winged helix-turn-helix transcriptional regulator [Sporolactobacillus laevolacticus]|uniref:MarR family winged helix-turn-helix transcriptional regulator n=1 Tax=Sporolactobacillus laevolacticus TaxID=33018 RepID=UPI0025B5AA82|nr:MarR family transcriptional regulator [Sporolactobacillus laevolacticus]MDN3955983.1 MarR family transcriptional regulator [Sporolactobacillus laevolacticus]
MKKKVEIAERKPSTCTFQNLHRASLAATKIYDQKLSKSGLTINQFSLLKTINHISPVSVSDLALEIRLDRTTLVRNLKPLEKAGLVVDVSPKGTRNRQLQLTSDGIKRYESAELLWQEAQEHIEQQLGKDNLNTLISLLFQIETL